MFNNINRDGEKKEKRKPLVRKPIARILAFTLGLVVFIGIAGFGVTLGTTEGDAPQGPEINVTGPNTTLGPNETGFEGDGFFSPEAISDPEDQSAVIPQGSIKIKKLVEGIEIWAWFEHNYKGTLSLYQLIDCFNLYSVSGDGASIDGLTPINSSIVESNGYILFSGLEDGWYAIEEVLTTAGANVFEQAPVMYIEVEDGVQGGPNINFDYNAFYTIVNGHGSGYVLGYPGLNSTGDIFPIAVTNAATGVTYHSFCANAGSTHFAGESGLGCTGYHIAERINRGDTNYVDFVRAYNYIESKYGNLNDYRAITQIITWVLLDAIVVPSAEFNGINWAAVESGTWSVKGVPGAKGIVEDVVANYKSYNLIGDIVDVVYMVCENPDHSYATCQPQLVPIYGTAYNNQYKAYGELKLNGTKVVEGKNAPAQQFSFSIWEGNKKVTSGLWPVDGHIVFNPIPYSLGDVGHHEYVIKEDVPDSLPSGWTIDDSEYTIYVKVVDNGDGTLTATAYKTFNNNVYSGALVELDDYIVLDEDHTFINKYDSGKEYDAALRKWVSDVNGVVGDSVFEEEELADFVKANGATDVLGILNSRATANGGINSPAVRVSVGDYIEYTIRVFNQCPWPLYVEGLVDDIYVKGLLEEGVVELYASIVDNIPAGLNFVEAEGINEGWIKYGGRIYYIGEIPMLWPELDIFADSANEDIEFTANDEAHPFYHDVKVIFEVDKSAVFGAPIVNSAMILGITDEEGNVVDDIDSDFDQDELEKWYETDSDNDIYGKGKKGNRISDRDEHDIAEVYLQGRISVEVYKDTIKRTSVAFDGENEEIATLAGRDKEEGDAIDFIYNVGIEEYRYDIHFRSTSNVDADEFVVEDPFEDPHFQDGTIRLTGLWTPAVWGDMDGMFNVYYRSDADTGTNNPNGKQVTDDSEGQMYPSERIAGWVLWKTIDVNETDEAGNYINPGLRASYNTYGVIGRVYLGLPDGFDEENDWIIGLRFEYGPVKVGFTSCMGNVMTSNLGDGDTLRFTNDSDLYRKELEKSIVDPNIASDPMDQAVLYSTDMSPVQAMTAYSAAPFSLEPFASADPVVNVNMVGEYAGGLGDIPDPNDGQNFNWKPVPGRSDYPKGQADIDQLADAAKFAATAALLRPATYMVKATESLMPDEENNEIEVVSSAIAYIGLKQTVQDDPGSMFSQAADPVQFGMYGNDQDGVLTRFIMPFTFYSDPVGGEFINDNGETNDIRFDGARLIDGVWYDRNGNRIGTGDAFTLSFWLVLIACAAICLTFLIRTYIAAPGKQGKKKEIVPGVEKGGGM